jgi:serine/threonine protein kinase
VWSIGVILYALLCGHLPWNGESQAEISHNSIKGIYDEPQDISASGRDLIRRMLNPCPKARITIAEIRQHAWMNEGYDAPPPSMLTARKPVFEVKDEIIAQLVSLGFKNEDVIRKQILDNECCQVVTMYHLILDKKVAEEMAELKNLHTSNHPQLPASSPMKVPASKIISMKGKPAAIHGGSPLRAQSLLAAIVEEANEVSQAEWNKIQQGDMEEHAEQPEVPEPSIDSVSARGHNGPSPNYHHQHDSIQHQHDAMRLSLSSSGGHARSPRFAEPSWHESRQAPTNGNDRTQRGGPHSQQQPQQPQQQRGGARAQLSTSMCVGAFDKPRPGRRFSVATPTHDQLVHNRSLPQASHEFGTGSPTNASRSQHHRREQQQQQQQHPSSSNGSRAEQQQAAPQDPNAPPAQRGRKFSLDSRAISDLQQISQEHGGGPGAPRLVKGVFKSSTTTTRPPNEAAKLVKKVLSNSSFFVKRKSPYIFECLDDETGVKFQLEVCKISQLDMTGVHLKRLVGDIWAYKNMCTTLVNKLSL